MKDSTWLYGGAAILAGWWLYSRSKSTGYGPTVTNAPPAAPVASSTPASDGGPTTGNKAADAVLSIGNTIGGIARDLLSADGLGYGDVGGKIRPEAATAALGSDAQTTLVAAQDGGDLTALRAQLSVRGNNGVPLTGGSPTRIVSSIDRGLYTTVPPAPPDPRDPAYDGGMVDRSLNLSPRYGRIGV